ncbi:YY1-associated factor 2 [Geospiza fortis]|uniref:YY1-associated factor 2 n=1 Tax=Geospiza fortis TaxID=48883 RepID=A0A8N5HWG2_GEOFO|nr:YY1-associated factor 2 [Geospiza fortis]
MAGPDQKDTERATINTHRCSSFELSSRFFTSSMGMLQPFNVLVLVRGPELDTVLKINTPTKLGVVCKLTENAFDPLVQIINEDNKQDWPELSPGEPHCVDSLRLEKSKHYACLYICAHRKPRPVSQLVAQQVPQQFVPPTQSKKEKKDKVEKEKSEKETTSKKNSHKKTRPRLKNVDRSSAQHLEVTVGDLTVIITDFKEKTKSPPASSAASADQHSQSGSSSDNTERGMSRSSSPRGEASSLNGESH